VCLLPSYDGILPATNFQFVAVGIFEKAGVITTAVTATEFGAFQVFSANFSDEPCEPINLCTGLSPKSDSRSVGLMTSVLGEPEERFRIVAASGIEYSPSAARSIAGETKHRQQLAVELVCALQVAYAHVDMVEVSRLFHLLKDFAVRGEGQVSISIYGGPLAKSNSPHIGTRLWKPNILD
jgi:hypothetical protein